MANLKAFGINSKDMVGYPLKSSIDMSEKLLCHELVVDAWITETIQYDLSIFDWNMNFSQSPTTFQLFLQGLKPATWLTGGYVMTKKKEYFTLANEFFHSWIIFSQNAELAEKNEYIWDQHAAALRAEGLLYFFLIGHENRLFSDAEIMLYTEQLERHAQYLADGKNYLKNQNHGLFQDKALLFLGHFFQNQEWVELSKNRLLSQWNFLFTDEMACVENSFTYQRVNKALFVDILKMMEQFGEPWAFLRGKLIQAEEFMGYALTPDGYCAPFGDSFRDDYSECEYLDEDGILAFSSRRGEIGKKPEERSQVYPKAGYYFGREFWDPADGPQRDGNFEDATWTMFRSGYLSITHRQADDNSFIFYSKGHDIFVDSGVYNYMFRDPIRRYLRSANAHNTVIVDESSFAFLRPDLVGFSGILYHELNREKQADYVVGYNLLYYGVCHIRHFLFLKEAVFIFDELTSHYEHKYSQLFHCGKVLRPLNISNKEMLAAIQGTDYFVHLKQLEAEDHRLSVHLINGAAPGAEYGILSESCNQYEYIDTLRFDAVGENVCFATIITIENSKGETAGLSGYSFDSTTRRFCWNEGEDSFSVFFKRFDPSSLGPKLPWRMDHYAVIQCQSRFKFVNEEAYPFSAQYAWYIIDEKTKKPVYKKMYEDDASLEFDFETLDGDSYAVRAFVMNIENSKKSSQIIAHIQRGEGDWSFRRELELDILWNAENEKKTNNLNTPEVEE